MTGKKLDKPNVVNLKRRVLVDATDGSVSSIADLKGLGDETASEYLEALAEEHMNGEMALVSGKEGKPKGSPGRSAVPVAILEKRNARIIDLYKAGLSKGTILKQINLEGKTRGWGELETEQSVGRVISKFYSNLAPTGGNAKEYEQSMKEAIYSQQESLIEKMALYIAQRNTKGDWKPFEYMAALETVARIRQQMIENRNWNASRANPLIQFNQTNNTLNQFETNSEVLIAGEASAGLASVRAFLAEAFPEDGGE